jgi:DNA-binding HxlR family transcriptional regulator
MNYYDCPVTRTLEVIGGKWKPIILHYLAERPRRSGELARLIPQASGKMLTQQLRELERDRIVRRKVYSEVPPKVEYSLSPLGETLRPIMIAMCVWGEANPKSRVAKGRLRPLAKSQDSTSRLSTANSAV